MTNPAHWTADTARMDRVSWDAADEYLDSLESLTSDVVGSAWTGSRRALAYFPNTALAVHALAYPSQAWSGAALADLDDVANVIAMGYPAAAAVLAEAA